MSKSKIKITMVSLGPKNRLSVGSRGRAFRRRRANAFALSHNLPLRNIKVICIVIPKNGGDEESGKKIMTAYALPLDKFEVENIDSIVLIADSQSVLLLLSSNYRQR